MIRLIISSEIFLIFIILANTSLLFGQDSTLINLPARTWYEIPNSRLDNVKPDPLPQGNSGLSSVIIDWSGGAFDTKRDQLIIWGGGHADYSGNEIYIFDVNSFSWERLWGPTPNASIPTGDQGYETYNDGNPSARHTYEGLEYIPVTDELWSHGGSRWHNGYGTDATWVFNFSTFTWSPKSNIDNGGLLGEVSAYNQDTKKIILQTNYQVSEYDPLTNHYSVRGNEPDGGWWDDDHTAEIDLAKNLFIAVGGGDIRVWDLETWKYSTPNTSGGSKVIGASAPGLAYDPVLKKIVAWAGGTSVFVLDTELWTWAEYTSASNNKVVPTDPTSSGTFGRWRYIPSKNAYIVVNNVDQNVYIYKLTQGPGIISDHPQNPGNLNIIK